MYIYIYINAIFIYWRMCVPLKFFSRSDEYTKIDIIDKRSKTNVIVVHDCNAIIYFSCYRKR